MGSFTSDAANLRKAFTTVTYALHLDQGGFFQLLVNWGVFSDTMDDTICKDHVVRLGIKLRTKHVSFAET
jgi:hypothetical protein